MRGLTLLGLATAAFAAEIQQRDLDVQHDGHVGGFHLRSIFAGGDVLTQYNIKPTQRAQREAQSLALPDVDVQTASRARTIVCAKLALVLHPGLKSLSGPWAGLEEIAAAGDGVWSASNATREVELMIALVDSVSAEIGAEATSFSPTIKAALWVSPGDTSILAFFGAYGMNDDLAVMYQSIWYNIDKTAEKMKDNWVNKAGLAWGEKQQAAENMDSSFYYNSVRDEQVLASSVLTQGLASMGTPVGTVKDAFEIAYGVFSTAVPDKRKFMMTGGSLGGSRAAAASIFLKTQGVPVPTITFSSTGSACWNYRMFSGDTVAASTYDTSKEQPQLTEYVHPLDTYGNAYGLDIGNECYVGLDESAKPSLEQVKSWCGAVYGYDGTYLVWADAAKALQSVAGIIPAAVKAAIPGLLRPVTQQEDLLLKSHSQCRYFTHNNLVLYNSIVNELNADGTTKSGCHVNSPVPAGDNRCPMNRYEESDSDDDFFSSSTKAPPFYVFIVLAFIAIIFFVGRCIMCPPQAEPEENEPAKEVEVIETEKVEKVDA
ncbi:hypothetical protein DIPPA_33179 [Diplonema papillatum]|nr:hypothetical protein DIPPA_33179 [Diplonema papillatum]